MNALCMASIIVCMVMCLVKYLLSTSTNWSIIIPQYLPTCSDFRVDFSIWCGIITHMFYYLMGTYAEVNLFIRSGLWGKMPLRLQALKTLISDR